MLSTPVGWSTDGQALDEVVEVGDVGEHVVRHQEVGPQAPAHQIARRVGAEEPSLGAHSVSDGHFGDVGRRLDAEHRNAEGDEVLQQVPVVARDLDHQVVGTQAGVGRPPPGRKRRACSTQLSE